VRASVSAAPDQARHSRRRSGSSTLNVAAAKRLRKLSEPNSALVRARAPGSSACRAAWLTSGRHHEREQRFSGHTAGSSVRLHSMPSPAAQIRPACRTDGRLGSVPFRFPAAACQLGPGCRGTGTGFDAAGDR
jgi:hypothetical protein